MRHTSPTTTVLGIDPGLGICGWACVTMNGDQSTLIDAGAIRTKPADPMSLRLLSICNQIRDLVLTHTPDEVAIEDVFLAKDARAAFALGQARGAAIVGAALAGCSVHTYSALQVKQSVTGNGRASKEQVGFMVQRLLSLREPMRPVDSSDAAAIAICHISRCRHYAVMAQEGVR